MSIASVFLILFSLFLARFLTAYDPKQLIKGYLEIPNETAAKILISQSNPRYGRYKNKKEYRNKMSYLGLSLYIIWFVFIIQTIITTYYPISKL